MTTALAVGAALIALAFAGSVYERWLVKRRPQDLAWSVSLLLFVLGAASLAWGSALGWTALSFRCFYIFGAILNVPFLACGQVFLLAKRRTADLVFRSVCLLGAFTAGITLASPLKAAVPADRLPQGSEVFGVAPRVFAAVGSGVGALVVFVGTVVGAVRLARSARRGAVNPRTRRRLAGLVLLSVGTIVLSMSGSLNSRLGEMQAFSVTLTVGVAILFAGFLLSSA